MTADKEQAEERLSDDTLADVTVNDIYKNKALLIARLEELRERKLMAAEREVDELIDKWIEEEARRRIASLQILIEEVQYAKKVKEGANR